MSKNPKEEIFTGLMRESAVLRLGVEQAKRLDPAIQDMARSLASISEYPLQLEDEPAFFLSPNGQ